MRPPAPTSVSIANHFLPDLLALLFLDNDTACILNHLGTSAALSWSSVREKGVSPSSLKVYGRGRGRGMESWAAVTAHTGQEQV